jgi:predicted PurR-regulated permease PerM
LRIWLLGILVLIAVLTALSLASPVFVPIFMAMFIAAVLRPPVRGLMRLGLHQVLAATFVFLAFGCLLFALSASVYSPASKWIGAFPKIVAHAESKLTPLRLSLQKANVAAQKIEAATDLSPTKARPVEIEHPSLLDLAFRHSRILLAQVGIVGLLSYFLLVTPQPILPPRFLASFGTAGRRIKFSLREIETQLSRFMSLMALTNLCVGALTGIAVYLCGMPNPLLWAMVAGLFSFVPYVGPLATTVMIAGAAFVTFNDWQSIVMPAAAYFVIHLLASEIAMPLLQGKILTLHPVTIFMTVLLWGWMWGLAGAFLAVPIAVAIAIAGRNLLLAEAGAEPQHAPLTSGERSFANPSPDQA